MNWQVYSIYIAGAQHNVTLSDNVEGQDIGRGQQPERRRRGRGLRLCENENFWPNRQERQEV